MRLQARVFSVGLQTISTYRLAVLHDWVSVRQLWMFLLGKSWISVSPST